MVVSGIWHGADWSFVIWGGLHALGRCLTRELETDGRSTRNGFPRLVKQMVVFAFVTFTWIFFRAQSLEKSWLIIQPDLHDRLGRSEVPVADGGMVLAVWIYQLLFTSESRFKQVLEWPAVKLGLVVFMIVYLMVVAQPSTKKFIYFQF